VKSVGEQTGVSELGAAGLSAYFSTLATRPAVRWVGRIVEANAQTVESEGPLCSVGEGCEIVDSLGERHRAEVIGFRGRNVISMPLEATQGIQYGDGVQALGSLPSIAVGEQMQGRILNGLGEPLDGRPSPRVRVLWPLDGAVPAPMHRKPIKEPLQTGLRVIDGLLTVGRGQRVGIFGGSGVGKSTLIGMMTRNTAADLTVVALVGERGREVREFVEDSLGEEGLKRAVVVVSTSDQTPLLRMRAAMAATAIAEFHAARGKHVLLVLDSLTRYAMAAREVGLAAGEPPASKGYTPSVFTRLAKLVERAGNFEQGSITAFYTVLMEGDDQQDPIVDAVRSYLDGHVVLSRALAASGQYPPVDVLDSLSRLMPAVSQTEHRVQAQLARRLLAAHARNEDLLRIGAYKAGMDVELDRALKEMPELRSYMEQGVHERVSLAASVMRLQRMVL
jgi:flagellum-specific ATP synthase